jgi:hypothetical protein
MMSGYWPSNTEWLNFVGIQTTNFIPTDVDEKVDMRFPLTGEALHLLLSLPTGTPIGVLLDRLEEYPQEVQNANSDTVRRMVNYLRTKYPNGV